ncbi:MAG: class IV adenylate cyclase [Saprospiraceae bacterium]
MPQIIEIKAASNRHDEIRNFLQQAGADFRGTDHQRDTYFLVPKGRLKLRQGNIERNLIHYHRPNQEGPKLSEVSLYAATNDDSLHSVLTAALDTLVVVDKQREIYFIDNVKFHLDTVVNLGTFVEIEAIDRDGSIGHEQLLAQCEHYIACFGILASDLFACSYSDLLLQQHE